MTVPVTRQLSAVLAVGAVLVLAGCGVFLDAGSSLPEGADAVDRFESLDSYNASYTIEVTRDNETERWTGNRTVRPSTGQFYERFEPPDGNTTIGVNNGSVTWLYDTGSNTVRTYSADRGRIGGQHLRQLVNSARSAESDTVPVVPISPSFLLGGQSGGEVGVVGPKKVSYEGTGTVAGREAHIIDVTSATEGDNFSQRYYLDTEWFVQLKLVSNLERDNTSREAELEISEIEYDPDLPDDLFEFTPPADATVESAPIQRNAYQSRAELEDATSFSIPEAEPPAAFELQRGQHIVTNSSRLTANATEDFVTIAALQYASDRASFVVQKSNTTFEQNGTDGEQVDVAGRTGRYRQVAGQVQVSWRCNGHRYAVSGDLTRETLLDVADSVACE